MAARGVGNLVTLPGPVAMDQAREQWWPELEVYPWLVVEPSSNACRVAGVSSKHTGNGEGWDQQKRPMSTQIH